jgi:uncharacterized protein (DUF3084 family)
MSATSVQPGLVLPVQMPDPHRTNWAMISSVLTMMMMAAGLMVYLFKGDNKADLAFAGIVEIRAQLVTLTASVQPVAPLNARVSEIERRATGHDLRSVEQDRRIGILSEALAELRGRFETESRPGRRVTP